MNIGLFSDSYLPSLDGISYSIEAFRVELEKRGHTVTVFAPSPSIRYKEKSPNIVRFPAVKGLFYDDYLTSMFFPPEALLRIKRKKLDIVHFHTPSQIGLLGAYYALRSHTPLISTYHTDLYEYVSHYPQVLPGTIALSLMSPMITGGGLSDFRKAISSIKPERNIDKWNKKIVMRGITALHNRCDYVIAPSRKIRTQLEGWGTTAPIRILPSGVDPIPTTARATSLFRSKWGLNPDQPVILFVGRLGKEKNIELLIEAYGQVRKQLPEAKLVIVGRHEHQKALQAYSTKHNLDDGVIFTGHIEHDRLGAAYASANVFAFPSRTDTQGLVLHEAANAGLPIVMIDKEITEVVHDKQNGLFARNSAGDMARKLLIILKDSEKQQRYGAASRQFAAEYSASHQAKLLEELYQKTITSHRRAAEMPPAVKP
ncbi:glycosyltransferase family 4 protein [Patescibacteria group bacterium]|nr:MAG: glycosyltransferase family 4 protein [Patescibacteria group bacterium]